MFVVLTLDSPTPLQTTRGPIRTHLVPAPASLVLLVLGLALGARRRALGSRGHLRARGG